jgi:Divergent InlB B-repeat domain/Right handed beta helix region
VGTEAQPTRTRIAALAAIVIGAGLFASVLASAERAAAASNCARVAAPSGSDTGAGTVESPFATPQRLVDSLAPGQTGCFRAGTYSFATLTLETAGITLAPYDSEAVTLAGAIKALPGAANSVIEGMTLNGSSSTDSKIGPKIYASGFTLRGNEVTNDHTEICVLVTSYYDAAPPRGVLIERNRIHDCGALPSTNMDHGIYLSAAVNPIVRDNWIYSNADRGIQQYPDAHGAQITGNVIAANGYGVNFSGTGSEVTSDATVAGNIVVDSSLGYNAYSGGDGPDGTNNFFRDNCVHAASGASGIESNARSFSAAGNLTATPGFVNPAAGDYRLRSDSPCLAKYTGTMSLPGSSMPRWTVSAQTAGAGIGIVTSSGVACPGDCSETYDQGQRVTLTATPSNGSTFAGWSGACSGTGACELTMDSDKSVTASFNPAPPPPPTTSFILRPNVDLESGWRVYGANAAWDALDENITTATKPGRADYIQPIAAGQVAAVGLDSRPLGGATPKSATVWYYAKSPADTQLRAEVSWGGVTRATQTLPVGTQYKWWSITVNPADQAAVDDLNLRFTSLGGRSAVVRAAYVSLQL